MLAHRRIVLAAFSLAPLALTAAGCGGSPPPSNPQHASGSSGASRTNSLLGGGSSDGIDAEDEIAHAVLVAHTNIFDDPASVEVVSIDIGKWEIAEKPALDQSRGLPDRYTTTWTAKLRFKEPLAFILSQLEGTSVVQIMAKAGDELAFQGKAGAMKFDGKWEVNAATVKTTDGGPWTPLWEKAGDVTLGYKVFGEESRQVAFRPTTFQSVSRLGKWVEQGSPEQLALFADFDARVAKAQADAKEQQRRRQEAAAAEQTRVAAEAAEKQRVAQETAVEQKRVAQETAAEQKRVATEAAQAKADAARRTRLAAVLKPLQSGVALATNDAGAAMGLLLSDVKVDEEHFTVAGKGISLREMPFREFTFDGSVDERGAFTFHSTLGDDPLPFALAGEKLTSRSGWTLAAPTGTDRAASAAAIELGARLQSEAPVEIGVEVLDAAAARAREKQLELAPLTGTVSYLGRVNAKVLPLFSANLAAKKPFVWKNQEVVALRLAAPVRGKGLYVCNGNPTESLEVLVNGVHKAAIASIPKLGGAVLTLPPGLEVLEIRLTAVGSAQVRTIARIP